MKFARLAAVVGALVTGSAALGAAGAASAAPTVFQNPRQTAQANDLDISSLSVDATAESFTLQATVQNFDPAADYTFNVYATPTQTTLSASPSYTSYIVVATPGSTTVYTAGKSNGTDVTQTPLPGATVVVQNSNSIVLTIPAGSNPSTPTYVSASLSNPGSVAAGTGAGADPVGFGPISLDPIATTITARLSSPSQVHNSTPAVVVAHVEASKATGSIDIVNGATVIATSSFTGTDVAITLPTSLAYGAHTLVAIFHPTLAAGYTTSSSAPLALDVLSGGIKTSTKLTLTHSKQHVRGKAVKVTVKVSHKPSGKVAIYNGTKKLKTLKLTKGTASYTMSKKLAKGKYRLHAVFTPTHIDSYAPSTSKAKTLKVVK